MLQVCPCNGRHHAMSKHLAALSREGGYMLIPWLDVCACLHLAECQVPDCAGATLCNDCRAGKYTVSTGNTAESDCVLCEAGKYSAAAGAF